MPPRSHQGYVNRKSNGLNEIYPTNRTISSKDSQYQQASSAACTPLKETNKYYPNVEEIYKLKPSKMNIQQYLRNNHNSKQ